MPFKDLTGKRFGRLTVTSRAANNKHGQFMWNCLCNCGQTSAVLRGNLTSGSTKSCGCLAKEGKHGMSRTPEYKVWVDMRSRCGNPNHKWYPHYGGRGIAVCEPWLESFSAFYRDMGKRPGTGYSIERKNNNKGYSQDNCKWATSTEQNRNQGAKSNNLSGVKGVYRVKKDGKWAATIRTDGGRVWLGQYCLLKDAAAARKAGELKYWGS